MFEQIDKLITNVNEASLIELFKALCRQFRAVREDLTSYIDTGSPLRRLGKVGEIEFCDNGRLVVVSGCYDMELSRKSNRRRQYEIAKTIIKDNFYDCGIFVFYDGKGRFRFSFVNAIYSGQKRSYSSFKRYTYFVDPAAPNKTFRNQLKKADFSSIEKIQKAFSIDAVTNDFYDEFIPLFEGMSQKVIGKTDAKVARDFCLLFAIRIIFVGFVQKKKWLGGDGEFLQNFWEEYKRRFYGTNRFYSEWLEPLFFEAFNTPPGHIIRWGANDFSDNTRKSLQMAPFLNGELFKRKKGYDDCGLGISDECVGQFFSFLFSYNFTIEENTRFDEELELNPEFLGIIFERLINKEDGAVYTPRTEVDFMCRLSLVKWLEKNSGCERDDLYHLLFRDCGKEAQYDQMQKQGDFSAQELGNIYRLLQNITVCDPAAGSGAFEVGMMQVLNDVMDNIQSRNNCPEEIKDIPAYERKKQIIANSLYGVEVKEWAVWINQLRLWLSLFIDMDDECKGSLNPLLPNLNFKVRRGDSIVQTVGGKLFPVDSHADIDPPIKTKITELKKLKHEFYYNDKGITTHEIERKETIIFREIIGSEIHNKKVKIEEKRLSLSKRKGQGFLFGDIKAPKKDTDDFKRIEQEIEALESEIAYLTDELASITDNHPLVWNIEFSEIFSDRGGFDIVIGNPPYVRQEDIGDPNDNIKAKDYKELIQKAIIAEYERRFGKAYKINGKSDLYVYFYLKSLKLLNKNGIHCFICSNSWLDVGYGVWMQEFLLSNARMHFIIDNHARRSFASADVNTVITVFDAPGKPDKDAPVKFVAFKKSFDEAVLTENLLQIEDADEILKTDAFRVYPVSAAKLMEEGSEYEKIKAKANYIGDKWGGKYLRAPDIFFTILQKGKDKLVKLKDVADVRFGIKTGCNEFFYLTDEQAKQWGIEDEFLRPVIKSPRECRSILINPDELKYKIFMCNKSKEELAGKAGADGLYGLDGRNGQNGTGALAYIEWGERQEIEIKQGQDKGKVVKGYNNVTSLFCRKDWHCLPSSHSEKIAWSMMHAQMHNVYYNPYGVELDHNFFEIMPIDDKNTESLALICVSSLAILIKEMFGRNYGGGSGPLKNEGVDIEKYIVLDPKTIKVPESSFRKMCQMQLSTVFEECGIDPKSEVAIEEQEPCPLADRKELDDIVFDALGLTEDERKDVYRAVCRLVWNRISKAKSV